jgi:predicted phage terminase large subunit-like protein
MNNLLTRINKIEKICNPIFHSRNSDLPDRNFLLNNQLEFTKYFYKLRTGRDYIISTPPCRFSHHVILADLVPNILNHEVTRLIVNIPPRYGKTEWALHLVARGIAEYPDSNFMYITYEKDLATLQTSIIRQIISLPEFRTIFGVNLSKDFNTKAEFQTDKGGIIYAVGANGAITGRGAGINLLDRFGGLAIIDDIHKPSEIHSDTSRESIIHRWWPETFMSRLNNKNTPVIIICQRLHEDDIITHLKSGYDTYTYKVISIPALDEALNALDPNKHSKEKLLEMKEHQPYVFSAQYQQEPQPAGGSLYKKENFEPYFLVTPKNIIKTFITVDAAETEKNYNDATVFSFWGIYEKEINGVKTGVNALHWLDCEELWIEPKDLKDEFMNFYTRCLMFHVKPLHVGIEKKSAGITLLSMFKEIPGIYTIDTTEVRPSKTMSKIDRFISVQDFVSNKRITFTENNHHVKNVVKHLSKITANNTHKLDDIADTMVDAIYMLLNNIVSNKNPTENVIPGYRATYARRF